MRAPRLALPLLVAALAGLSLLLPFALLYDPWAWLVWGREALQLDLDTSAGPSWKPLPVLVAAALSPAGDAAPELWTLIARAGWLAAIAFAARLAARLVVPPGPAAGPAPRRIRTARLAAAALAAAAMLLLFDPFTTWVRQFAGGLSEPMLVALVLAAVDRQLDGRSGQALALGFAAALLRPEAWPLLAAYGVWLWRREPGLRAWLVAAGVAVPLLWVGPDVLGSGDPLTGAERARDFNGPPLAEGLEAVGRALNMVLAGLWVTAAYAVWTAWRRRERALVVLAVGAVGWIATVAVLAAAGYAGLPRFAAPAAAIGCVLGAVGAVRLADAAGRAVHAREATAPAAVAAVALALAISVQGAVRGAGIPADVRAASAYGGEVEDLFGLVGGLGAERLDRCGQLTTSDFLVHTALAWELDRPIASVAIRVDSAPSGGTVLLGSQASRAQQRDVARVGRALGARGAWSAYEISCARGAPTVVARPARRETG